MADVSRITGPGSPSEPIKSAPGGDPTKFKELMKVDDTDTDQRKKKKQHQEALEETKAKRAAAPASQRSSMELQTFKKPAKIERAKDKEHQQASSQQQSAEAAIKAEEIKQMQKKQAVAKEAQLAQFQKQEKKNEETANILNTAAAQSIAIPQLPPPEEEIKQEKTATVAQKTTSSEKKSSTLSPALIVPPPVEPIGPFFIPAASASAPGYTQMSSEAFALLEKLISALVVMHEGGISETTITLSADEFATFGNSKIVIREYSTAPKTFNIEFLGNAQTTALFDLNATKMLAAFQQGKYNFKINRIESAQDNGLPKKVRRKDDHEKGTNP